jgi:hypothetical protein
VILKAVLIGLGGLCLLTAHVMVFVLALRWMDQGVGRAPAVRAAQRPTYPTVGDQLVAEFQALDRARQA